MKNEHLLTFCGSACTLRQVRRQNHFGVKDEYICYVIAFHGSVKLVSDLMSLGNASTMLFFVLLH